MKTRYLLGLLVGLSVTGCSAIHRGVVAMKVSDTVAHVCLNKDEVRLGDSVKLYRNVCSTRVLSKHVLTKCEKRLLGTGSVTEILNEHYSVVSVPAGTDLKEGDFVER